MNPLQELRKHGQSIWLEYIRRSLVTGGELERLVREEGLRGISGDSAVFRKVIAGSGDYDDALQEILETDASAASRALYERLAVEDIRKAADLLREVYEETGGSDGFVCLELPPHLVRDARGGIEEARRLRKEVNRPNLMLKVPAVPEGIPVMETLVAEGVHVNATFLFSLEAYEAVARAYLRGLERCADPAAAASVASFSVGRVDRAVDRALEAVGTPEAVRLKGKIAAACAKKAYRRFKEIFGGKDWEPWGKRGARVQRLLWADTEAINPASSDVYYVEELIGAETVSAVSPATLAAFRQHGRVRATLESGLQEAEEALERLASLGVNLDVIAERLLEEGLAAFTASFSALLDTLERKRRALLHGAANRQILSPGDCADKVGERLHAWKRRHFLRRLWFKDPTLWAPDPQPEITDRLGWLELPRIMHRRLEDLVSFTAEVKEEGISQVVLLGMGGSSLAPEVFQGVFGSSAGHPQLTVLDSTHPRAVLAVEDRLDLHRTLFLVSSKSGTTLETLCLFRYFWNRVDKATGEPGRHFAAITDPGSPLTKLAGERRFRRVFPAKTDVGGRYSAFTEFGLVPAALIGIDIESLLERAWEAAENGSFCVPEETASGLVLGAFLGEAAANQDKVTFFVSPSLDGFPDWAEQLIAESTGKEGKGLIPVVNEPLVPAEAYGGDRLFVFISLEGDDTAELEQLAQSLERAGHPLVQHRLSEKADLGREIFWWEMAVASAGAVLGIHPFNQPDVRLAKDFTRRAMEGGPDAGGGGQVEAETLSIDEPEVLGRALKGWIGRARPGDYTALQAYLPSSSAVTQALQSLRLELLKRTGLATTSGYGPRFLHSTGQLHKGGPGTGLFLQIIDEPGIEIPVPETGYGFRRLIRAQALGDYLALKQRGRRVLRVNFKEDIGRGFEILEDLILNTG